MHAQLIALVNLPAHPLLTASSLRLCVAESYLRSYPTTTTCAPSHACRSEGIGIHACGKPERWVLGWGKPTPSLRLCTAPRHAIARHISTEAERVYGGRVKIERGWRLVGGAVCRGDLILEGPAGSTAELQFDVVVGADGVHSTARALMVAEVCREPGTVQRGPHSDVFVTWVVLLLCIYGCPIGVAVAGLRLRIRRDVEQFRTCSSSTV